MAMLVVVSACALCEISASSGTVGTYGACGEQAIVDSRLGAAVSDRGDQLWLEVESQLPAVPLTEKLAETGGVLAPPEGVRLIIVKPPPTGPNSMEIKPDRGPSTDADGQTSISATGASAHWNLGRK